MNTKLLLSELKCKAVRSSGAGGQHVNKVSSKIELTFDLKSSQALTYQEKNIIEQKLRSKITTSGLIIMQCSDSRSQHRNKELIIQRFISLLKSSLIIPKKRKATKPSKSSVQKRLDIKKKLSLKKSDRKKPLF